MKENSKNQKSNAIGGYIKEKGEKLVVNETAR